MLLGKILIITVFLFPVPCGFVTHYLIHPFLWKLFEVTTENTSMNPEIFNFVIEYFFSPLGQMPLWRVQHGVFWWPLLYLFAIGIILCVLSKYKSQASDTKKEYSFKNSPTRILQPLIVWGLVIIAIFWALVFTVVGFYYLFLTPRIEYSVPIMFGLISLTLLIVFGVAYKKNWENSHKETIKSKHSDGCTTADTTDNKMKIYNQNRQKWKQKEIDKINKEHERREASRRRKTHYVNDHE